MRAEPTAIPGCMLLRVHHSEDRRGDFTKLFQASALRAAGCPMDVAEMFWSTSRAGVVRGLHFQLPPHEHAKVVGCAHGRVLDAVVDLRVGSPMYGRSVTVTLDARDPVGVYVPVGCAHGFQALEDDAIVVYAVSSEHAPDHDAGVRYDSAGIPWTASELASPFRFR